MKQAGKLMAAGAVAGVTEPLLMMAHQGGFGVAVGLGLSVAGYLFADEFKQWAGGGKTPSSAEPRETLATNQKNERSSLAHRMWYGKQGGSEEALEDAMNDFHELPGTLSSDPRKAIYLAPDFAPHVNLFITEGCLCTGLRGSGKTGFAALLIEQLSKHGSPLVVYDKEGDLLSIAEMFPRFQIVHSGNWQQFTPERILYERLQIIVDLGSWETAEQQAAFICSLTDGILAITMKLDLEDCIPCPVFLDEAQYWLPQSANASYLGKFQGPLRTTFMQANSRGRKRGVAPFFFTQRIAQIDKSVVTLGIQVYMRQTLDVDQQRCMEMAAGLVKDKSEFASLRPGEGIVCLPGDVKFITRFNERESVHKSVTPGIERLETSRLRPGMDLRGATSLLPETDLPSSAPVIRDRIERQDRTPRRPDAPTPRRQYTPSEREMARGRSPLRRSETYGASPVERVGVLSGDRGGPDETPQRPNAPTGKQYLLNEEEIGKFLEAYEECKNLDTALSVIGRSHRYRNDARAILQERGITLRSSR